MLAAGHLLHVPDVIVSAWVIGAECGVGHPAESVIGPVGIKP